MSSLLRFSCNALKDNAFQGRSTPDSAAVAAAKESATAAAEQAAAAAFRRAADAPGSSGGAQQLLEQDGSADGSMPGMQQRYTTSGSPSASVSLSGMSPGSVSLTGGGSSRQQPRSRLQQPRWQNNPAYSSSYDGTATTGATASTEDGEEVQQQRRQRQAPPQLDGFGSLSGDLLLELQQGGESTGDAPPPTPSADFESSRFGRQSEQQQEQRQQSVAQESDESDSQQQQHMQRHSKLHNTGQQLRQQSEAAEAPGTPSKAAAQADKSSAALGSSPRGMFAAAASSPLKGLKSLRSLLAPAAQSPASAAAAAANRGVTVSVDGAASAAVSGDGSSQLQGRQRIQPRLSLDRHYWAGSRHRHTGSSGGSSDDEASGDEAPMSPLGVQIGQGSFRRRPGASVRQLARNIGRASGKNRQWYASQCKKSGSNMLSASQHNSYCILLCVHV
jgi:hypothetical protein